LPVTAPILVGVADSGSARASSWTFDVAAGGGRGVAVHDLAWTAVRADATAALGPWRWGAGIEWLHGLARSGRSMGSADLGALRAVLGAASGRFGLLAGPALAGYRVAGTSRVGFGASGQLHVQLPGGVGWHTMVCTELDVFFHRIVVERGGAVMASTPRVALSAVFGVAWGGR
jgi:hypothetical protein